MTVEDIYIQNEKLSKIPYNVFSSAKYNVNNSYEFDREDLLKKKVLARQLTIPRHIRRHLEQPMQHLQNPEI